MRVATARPTTSLSGIAMLIIGGAVVALSIALILTNGGGGSSSPAAGSVVDPYAATSATIAFWEARVNADPADFTAYNHLAAGYVQRGRETGDVGDYTRAQAAVDASLASLPGDNYTGLRAGGVPAERPPRLLDIAGDGAARQKLNPGDPYAPVRRRRRPGRAGPVRRGVPDILCTRRAGAEPLDVLADGADLRDPRRPAERRSGLAERAGDRRPLQPGIDSLGAHAVRHVPLQPQPPR